ncbi:hypothetical protein NET03_10780 [Thermomicrobium sp. CFH 73360]|uniref:hypothetical protein n=1 Tax=Thermomicrobium sp. CFH 73360 TaxID=2951987 RepID=UPI002076D582|nr:hypothetical protein [Thermomicrobium sp. CFH 73360]MCM8747009.1 hypothetical protein [Thermomicrobium sp. CFH 73360]
MAILLPYRTDPRLLFQVLEYAKGRGVDRSVLEARLGGGEPLRETLNALEQLGLIERDDAEVRLTEIGRRLAYATDAAERRRELARVVLSYPPYGGAIERALREGLSVMDGPWVERVWQVELRLGQPRNRVEEARTFFFKLAEEAGLGVFRRGVRGQPSRLVLAPALEEQVRVLRPLLARAEPLRDVSEEAGEEQTEHAEVQSEMSRRLAGEGTSEAAGRVPVTVTMTVTVDLTMWELEKIEAFLRLLGLVPEGVRLSR